MSPQALKPCLVTALAAGLLVLSSQACTAQSGPEIQPAHLDGAVQAEPADRRRPRRLREYATKPGAEWAIDPAAPALGGRPLPRIDSVTVNQVLGQLVLELTVTNASPDPSVDGGITISIPELDAPEDGQWVVDAEPPAGMTLQILPQGKVLADYRGRRIVADYLMVEVHGPWAPFEQKTFRVGFEPAHFGPWRLQYRSAMAGSDGRYFNAPAQSGQIDQQGWSVATEIVEVVSGDLRGVAAEMTH